MTNRTREEASALGHHIDAHGWEDIEMIYYRVSLIEYDVHPKHCAR
jgi:hypothetical protein